jgi:hypothetical protein
MQRFYLIMPIQVGWNFRKGQEMLFEPRAKLIVSGMSTNSNNAICAVRHLAFFEQDIEAIERNGSNVKRKMKLPGAS